ncbi:MAG: hypothetical protein OJF60_003171 [Burkholderiaceae bacterium]|jgi:hypothetical protein|nr:MAG: hypothetical protein OJF60_003171 [Burkholderiaceae bacterium]
MKAVLAALALMTPVLVLAQQSPTSADTTTTTVPTKESTVKPKAKHETKHETKQEARHETKRPVRHVAKKESVSTRRQNLKSAAVNAAAGIEAAEAALTPAELAVAQHVYTGKLPCELGESVTMTADPQSPGRFDLQFKKAHYRLSPVTTATGAVRLEDPKTGAVWLQLPGKSMLLNEKLGQRLADDCHNPQQAAVAENMKEHPGPGLFGPSPSTSGTSSATK